MNDDAVLFDLRPYLDMLVRRWRLIVSVAVLTTMAVAFYSLLSPPPYQAEALVAIVTAKTDVTFDPRFRTLSGEDLATAGASQAFSADARRNALLGLVQNGAIATQVIETLGNQLEPQQRDPALLMSKVSAQIVGKGDLISIGVQDSDRQRAAAIANAWALEYERQVNSIYGGAPDTLSSSVNTEFAAAVSDYEKAQKAVEEFTARNRLADLTRSIAEKQLIVKSLQDSRNAVFNKQIEAKLLALNNAYETRTRIQSLLLDARALQAQAIQGGAASSPTSNLSLLLLKAEVYASSVVTLPVNLQIQLGGVDQLDAGAQGQAADLQALVDTVEKRITDLDALIAQESKEVLNNEGYSLLSYHAAGTDPLNQNIAGLDEQIRGRQAELEQQQATQKSLVQARDIAWESYTTLARKQAEVGISSAVMGSVVRVAAPAVVPRSRSASRTVPVFGASLGGLVLGAFVVLVMSYVGLGINARSMPGRRRMPWQWALDWVLAEGPGLPGRRTSPVSDEGQIRIVE